MPFEWRRYVELARTLLAQAGPPPGDEAALRTALSRAYYGAFGFARDYAQRWLKYKPKGTEEDHRSLREYLWRKKRQGVARALDQLRAWRNSADYDDEVPFDLALTVPAAIREAERVLAALPPPKIAPT